MNLAGFKFTILLSVVAVVLCKNNEIDTNGYVLFCPGMGLFDNQVEQFLGALAFAKEVGRTIVLPYWIEYHQEDRDSDQIMFEKYFQIEPLKEYTKVITMDEFMKYIAPRVWLKGKRRVFCFTYRGDSDSCQAKVGNPYTPYWNKFGIDFDRDEKFAPLNYDMSDESNKIQWIKKYPKSKYPVLAFTSSPGDFPILKQNVKLQKYLKWSDTIETKANDFIDSFKEKKDDIFLGIHVKNGIEHYRACEHANDKVYENFYASAQCLGYGMENGKMSNELCYPPDHSILEQLENAIKKFKPKYVFVMIEIEDILTKFEENHKEVKFIKYVSKNPHVELAILGKADHVIVNCVSVASAFVKRQRDIDNKTTEFWHFDHQEKSEL